MVRIVIVIYERNRLCVWGRLSVRRRKFDDTMVYTRISIYFYIYIYKTNGVNIEEKKELTT